MLLNLATLGGIRDGTITIAFRRWRRPTVKAGGTLNTAIGQLAIEAVDIVDPDTITKKDAVAAGFADLEALRAELAKREGDVYRVRLALAGPDPRIALRAALPGEDELATILKRLDRMDARSATGPWTKRVLALIRDRPAERAADLAGSIGMDRDPFKVNVRKLKGLGLTESLEVGYRLSPRGDAALRAIG